MRRAGRGHHVLLDHERAEVIAAESERELADLESHRDPARLEVGHVVEDNAGHRHRAQVFRRAGLRHVRHRRRVLRLQRPGDERREPARPRLQVAHPLEVLDALGERFADAVHHGDGGLHPLVMCQFHDLEPAIGAILLRGDDITNALHEDLAAAARDRIQPGLPQLTDDLDRIHAEHGAEEVDFAR